jgi:excisionase family DNA binding protein
MAELMKLEEVADYLRVAEKTIYRLIDKQGIPSIRIGHQWRFDKADIDNWLRQNSTDAKVRVTKK